MAITSGYYGIGYKADGSLAGNGDTAIDIGGTERTLAGGYTTFATAIADIGALTGDLTFFVFYGDAEQGLSFAEHISWPNIDQNLYRLGFVGQLGSVGELGSQCCIDSEAEGIGSNVLNISTGTDARNGWYMHNLRLHADDSARAFYESTSQTYPMFTQCTFTGTESSTDLMYVASGNFVAHDCVIISRNGVALIPANGTSLIRCIIISTSSYALGGAAFTDVVGCTIYGSTHGMYGFSCAGSFRDNIVVGGTHAIYSAYVQGRLTYITSRNNNLFYSVANPTEISSGKTVAEYFGDDYAWMKNNFLGDPLFANAGGDTVADYALGADSPARALNQTPTDNLIYAGNKNDPYTFGAWNNYSDPTSDPPGAPGLTSATAGDGQVTLACTAADEADTIYARVRQKYGGAWLAENESFKRTGSGNIVYTGLNVGTVYQASEYAKEGNLTSDWAEPLTFVPNDGSLSDLEQILIAIKDVLVDAALTDAEGDALVIQTVADTNAYPLDWSNWDTSQIKIFPESDPASPRTSGANDVRYTITVAVAESIIAATFSNHANLRQSVRRLFLGKTLPLFDVAICTEETASVFFDQDRMREERLAWLPLSFIFEMTENRTL